MKRTELVLGALIVILPGLVWAQERRYKGEVLFSDDLQTRKPAIFVDVRIRETGHPYLTDEDGYFDAFLPDRLTPGKDITFSVKKKGYVIQSPLDGEDHIPDDLSKRYRIVLMKEGLPAILTAARADKVAREIQEKARAQIIPAPEQEAPIELDPIYREVAKRLGLPEEKIRQVVEQRAKENRQSSDPHQRALAASADNNPLEAAKNFKKAVAQKERELQQSLGNSPARLFLQSYSQFVHSVQDNPPLSYDIQKLIYDIVKEHRLAGHAFYNSYQFSQALEAYQKAAHYLKKSEDGILWADVQMDMAKASWAIGVQTEGPVLYEHLRQAKMAYAEAGKGYEELGYDAGWAAAQVGLGNTLSQQGIRPGGKEGRQRLAEAVEAFHRALTVYTREALPQDWAATENNLGNALTEQGIRLGGKEGRQRLAEAVEAFHRALTVYTREALPQDWAATENNLGNALTEQGIRTGGPEGQRMMGEAVKAFRHALRVRTRDKLPRAWAMTQNNLGNALTEQGIRLGGKESRQRLAEAVEAFQRALTVYIREALPQDWAATQNNLGATLRDQGIRTGGIEGQQLLAEAVTAYRAALEVRTRQQLPQQWAATQNNLGIALRDQGIRTDGIEAQRLLGEAVKAFRHALKVRTQEELPQDWAATQNNLGNALTEQGIRLGGKEGRQRLTEAVEAFQRALTVYTREAFPQDWAATQNNLGNVYRAQGSRHTGEKGRNLMAKAIIAFRQALKVWTMESTPGPWAQTHVALARTAIDIKDWEHAVGSYKNVLLLDPDYAEAYHALYYIFHDKLFAYHEAFALTSQWLNNHPDDLVAQTNFAEVYFTTGQFAKTTKHIAGLLEKPEIDLSAQIALRLLEIAALLAQEKDHAVPSELGTMGLLLRHQPEAFALEWDFAGTKHFIAQDTRLASPRDLLIQLLEGFEGEKLPTMLGAVATAQGYFISAAPKKEQP